MSISSIDKVVSRAYDTSTVNPPQENYKARRIRTYKRVSSK